MTPLEHIDFHIISYWTSNIVIVTYFFRGDSLSPHRLHFPISRKGSFICTFPQTELHIPQPLVDQLWITGWNKCIRHAGSIHHSWGSKSLLQSALPPELRPAPRDVYRVITVKPLLHLTRLAKWMETEQSPLKYGYHLAYIRCVSVACPLAFSKCFVQFCARTIKDTKICCPVLSIISIQYGVTGALGKHIDNTCRMIV